MVEIVIEDLTVEERLELIDRLWESLDDVGLSPEQIEEVGRRLETADADAKLGKTWTEIKESLAKPG